MTLDNIIGYRMLVIEAIQLTADSHMKDIELMYLNIRRRAPNVQVIIKFGK